MRGGGDSHNKWFTAVPRSRSSTGGFVSRVRYLPGLDGEQRENQVHALYFDPSTRPVSLFVQMVSRVPGVLCRRIYVAANFQVSGRKRLRSTALYGGVVQHSTAQHSPDVHSLARV